MITIGELQRKLKDLPDWGVDSDMLVKEFPFINFKDGAKFIEKVAELADDLEKSPIMILKSDGVDVQIIGESGKGLSDIDFTFAKNIEALLAQ